MRFKIDTKEKIVIFRPEFPVLDANLSEAFVRRIIELPELNGRNLILDMALVESADEAGIQAILTVYGQQYDSNLSCAITNVNNTLTAALNKDCEYELNITPTLSEAIDMVMMESLERDLLDGE
ncbi:STAS domain-containing protein [uncultured Chitinophaga sp.]|jgi:Sulfate permease and related transporters (MFS superfamily)|uniref:STAS domain-containing protein n=1 Tax=uncultured Chitinophaga sp. TaxID=339340 RepID=UPI0026120D4B|nr:STAS domain-containing protein [uncultured Chitinophaga sp.]